MDARIYQGEWELRSKNMVMCSSPSVRLAGIAVSFIVPCQLWHREVKALDSLTWHAGKGTWVWSRLLCAKPASLLPHSVPAPMVACPAQESPEKALEEASPVSLGTTEDCVQEKSSFLAF